MTITYIVWTGKTGKRKRETLTVQEYERKYNGEKPKTIKHINPGTYVVRF